MNPLLNDALLYLRRGISVIPVNRRKKPAIRKWKPYTERLPTEAEIRDWLSRPDVVGIAVIAGPVSGGLAIRDFDTAGGYETWARANSALAKQLPTVRTGRGYHVWFRSDLNKNKKLGDGDFRGAGYSVAPHSLHPSGGRYVWVIPLADGPLPFVAHAIFTGPIEAEKTEIAEAIVSVGSAISADSVASALSAQDPDSLILSTLPKKLRERNGCLLNLARGMKFNLGMGEFPIEKLRPFVQQWHQLALPVIGTKPFVETWADFLHAFKGAKYPLGTDAVDEAARHVDAENLPAFTDKYDEIGTKILVALCFEMAKRNGGYFFLSTHDAAPRVRLTPGEVWRRFRMLEDEGLIKVVERGNRRRATRYRWNGEFPTGRPSNAV